MKLGIFFEKFDLFVGAPDALRSMREIVLQLAVRGKLVVQSQHESARSQLALAEAFRIRRGYREESDPEDIPFHIPGNWGWAAVGDTMEMVNGKAFKPEEWSSEGTPIIRIQNLNNENAGFNRSKIEVDPKVHVHDGDFLISWSGTPGTSFGAFIWNRAFAYLNQHIFRCELVEGVFEKAFLRLAINARLDEMISHAQGAVGLRHITKGKLESIRLPLPPLAEQKRIVAKVDELMALCDRLEAQQQERETQHAALARASLARFAEAPTPANLDTLFHKSYSIPPADLRKSILTLAVQGKLVPQDPNDEPADELIARIARDRERIAKQQGVRSPKNVPELRAENYLYDIPDSWQWSRVGNLALVIDYGTSQRADNDSRKVPVYRMGNIIGGRLVDENLKFVDSDIDDLPGLYLKTHDILFNRTNSYELVGKVGIYTGSDNTATFASYLIRIRLPEEHLFPPFFNLAMNASYFRQTQIEPEVVQQCGQANFNGTKLASTVVPVPPLAEQRRIVAKVDELMALVDQLEEQLATAKKKSTGLLEAVVHELLSPSAEIIPFPSASATPLPDREAIGCYAIQRLAGTRTFGRTAQMKVLYLAEAHIGMELGGCYSRDAAGPLDQWIYMFEKQAAERQWFSVAESATKGGHVKVEYRKGPKLSAKTKEVTTLLSPELRTELDRLLDLLANKPTIDVEIIATLFAAWNDALIDGHAPSDAEIIRDVRENWHPSKQRFKEPELKKWLDWMRQHALVPKGRGPHTRGSQVALRLH